MAKKKREAVERVMVSRRLPKTLWERFQEYCLYHVPRVSDTEMMEKALGEFLKRYEPKQKGEAGK